tara:strand:+ start:509 stop:799 length:291 start_codon:yes stop_codon:yes gene_type:complete
MLWGSLQRESISLMTTSHRLVEFACRNTTRHQQGAKEKDKYTNILMPVGRRAATRRRAGSSLSLLLSSYFVPDKHPKAEFTKRAMGLSLTGVCAAT